MQGVRESVRQTVRMYAGELQWRGRLQGFRLAAGSGLQR